MAQPKRSIFFRAIAAFLSSFYGIGVNFRNFLFNTGVITSKKFRLPIISVGNITVGGTGKTPHSEFILSTLTPYMEVALLSRGYKRKTKDFIIADSTSTADDIGDEPYQIHKKFPEVIVAIDTNRRRAIENLQSSHPNIGAVVLDDAYQHRFVEPGINILLIDYNRPLHEDHLLPLGELREPEHNKHRANIIVITKCPETASPIDYRLITKHLKPRPYQTLYFSSIKYEELKPAFGGAEVTKEQISGGKYGVVLLTGIQDDSHIKRHVNEFSSSVKPITFPDHHDFTMEDIQLLEKTFSNLGNEKKIIITTEKDAARLEHSNLLTDELKSSMYVLPIKVKILFDKEEEFKKQILDYVKKNTTNNKLSKDPIK
ncbi:MAG: tetraacyldisaccharide 4'-kinase [Paludibacteraceae bacterium]|nr:tetraacyldisaccharide 4'-kinase [Paludibacteraceae bacterium]